MKKTILTIFALALVTAGFSQFSKGRILAGGSVGFSSSTEKSKTSTTTVTNGKQTNISFTPRAGYFVIDNLAAGLGISLSTSKFKPENTTSSSEFTSSTTVLSPFIRYYLSQGIFFQGEFGIGSGKTESKFGNTTTTNKYGVSQWSIGGGYAYFLNDNVAIEPFIGYQSTTLKDKNVTSNKDLSSGLFLNIAFQVYLGSK